MHLAFIFQSLENASLQDLCIEADLVGTTSAKKNHEM